MGRLPGRRAQINLAPFPALDPDVVQPAKGVAEGIPEERVVRWPEGDGIHAGGFGEFDCLRDGLRVVKP